MIVKSDISIYTFLYLVFLNLLTASERYSLIINRYWLIVICRYII